VLFAAPALAITTWDDLYLVPEPGTTVSQTNLVEAYAVDDTYPIVAASMTIDGFPVSPLSLQWLGTQSVLVSFDPVLGGLLPPGQRFVVVSATNSNGDVATKAWDFFVNVPPQVTAVVPAEDAYVTSSLNPTVTVTLSDPDDATFTGMFASSRALRVDGVTVVTTYDVGTKTYSYKRPIAWANPSNHHIEFSVRDSAYNVVSKDWYFTVDTTPDVVNPTLSDPAPTPGSTTARRPTFSITASDNRPGDLTVKFILDGVELYSQSRPQGITSWTPTSNLALGERSLTAQVIDGAGNSGSLTWTFTVVNDLTASHTTTTDFTTCAPCHNPVISTEHVDRGLVCDTCHASTDPDVENAIADGNTDCWACHDYATSHEAIHTSTIAGTYCENCHDSNLVAAPHGDCASCHSSTDPLVVAAIAAGTTGCKSCHPAAHTSPHGGYTTTTNKCGDCHSTHYAKGSYKLLRANKREAACDYCHGYGGGSSIIIQMDNVYKDNDGSGTMYLDGIVDAASTPEGGFGTGHTLGYTGRSPTDINPAYQSVDGLSCFDCHSPHGNSARVMTVFSDPGRPIGTDNVVIAPGQLNFVGNVSADGILDADAEWGVDPVHGNYKWWAGGRLVYRPIWPAGRFMLLKNPHSDASELESDTVVTTAGDEVATDGVNKLKIDWSEPLGPADGGYGGYQDNDNDNGFPFAPKQTVDTDGNGQLDGGFLSVSEFCVDCHDGAAGASTQPAEIWYQAVDAYQVAYSHDAQPRH
jgi:hypothetical protein